MAGAITPLSVRIDPIASPVRNIRVGGGSTAPIETNIARNVPQIQDSFKKPASAAGATVPSAGPDPGGQLGPLSPAEHRLIRRATKGVAPAAPSHMDVLESNRVTQENRGVHRNVAVARDRANAEPTNIGSRPLQIRTDPPAQLGPLSPVEHEMIAEVARDMNLQQSVFRMQELQNGTGRRVATPSPLQQTAGSSGAGIDILA